jgi:hypothetical protein
MAKGSKGESTKIIFGIGIEIVFLILEIKVKSMPDWLAIIGYIIGGVLIIWGARAFCKPLDKAWESVTGYLGFAKSSPTQTPTMEESPGITATNTQNIITSLNRAKVAAEGVLTLPPNADISHNLTDDWLKLKAIDKVYEGTSKILGETIATCSEECRTKIKPLISSLARGRSLILDALNREPNLAKFRTKLDANSKKIIKQVDALLKLYAS